MSIYNDMRAELKELVQLIRQDEKYAAVVARGLIKLDQQSSLSYLQRTLRIDELSRKYGIL